MIIKSRFDYKGTECFILEDDGYELPSTLRGLYCEINIEALVQAGYKFFDYHGNILTPDGISIHELALLPCTLSENEIRTFFDLDESALSEAEASQYFCREVNIKGIDLAESKNEINTREELKAYLDRVQSMLSARMQLDDIRPLNSFVAKEALFTMEEYVSNTDDAIRYMGIISKRRILQSFKAYQDLISFLQEEGVLSRVYSYEDVKRAYLSWGICGLNCRITSSQVIPSTLDRIYNIDTKVSEGKDSGTQTGRSIEWCLLDREGNIYYSGGKIDLMEFDDFTHADAYPARQKEYDDLMRSKRSWGEEYKCIRCLVSKPVSRSIYTILEANGIVFKVKVDYNTIVIQSSKDNIYASNFLCIKGMDGTTFTIDHANSRDEFRLWNLAVVKARDLIREKTVKPPVDNSYDLCVREGVTSINTVAYLARRIKEHPELNPEFTKGINYMCAETFYRDGPSPALIKKYNPENLEYSNIDELIDIMLNTRNEMIDRGEYLNISSDDLKSSNLAVQLRAREIQQEMIDRPLECLEFVKVALDGGVTIDNLASGKQLDEDGADNMHLAQFLLTFLRVVYPDASDIELAEKLATVEKINLIDFNSIVKERDNAFKAYLLDRAILNNTRAEQCGIAACVTRVYRELANVPVEEQRHCVMECLCMDTTKGSRNSLGSSRNYVANAIRKAVEESSEIEFMYKGPLSEEALSIALYTMFQIKLGNIKPELMGNGMFRVGVVHNIEGIATFKFDIEIADGIYKDIIDNRHYKSNRVLSLYDWCQEEMQQGAWNLYCLNANITPWKVTPKEGMRLMEYPFEINYLNKDTIIKGFSEKFIQRIISSKAKVNNLCETYSKFFLFEDLALEELGMDYDVNTINSVLDVKVLETIAQYEKRFKLLNNKAKSEGKYLKRMQLKSDVVLGNYGDSDYLDENVYEAIPENKLVTSQWITTIEPRVLSNNSRASIDVSKNNLTEYDAKEQTYNDVSARPELLFGEYVPYGVSMIVGTTLLVVTPKGKLTRDLLEMTEVEANQLAEKGVFYRIGAGKYLIKTCGKDYQLEIR